MIIESIEKKVDSLGIGESWSYLDIVDVLRTNESIYSFKINSTESDKEKKLLFVGDEMACSENQIFIRNESLDAIIVEYQE